jgi:hypothetical protein
VTESAVPEATGTKVAGMAGVLGVALPCAGVVVLPIWQFPGTGSSASELTTFVLRHETALSAAMVLNAAGVALWLIFGAGVWLRLRDASGQDNLLSACFAVGLIGFVILLLAGFVAMFLLSYSAKETPDARLLYDLTFGLLAMSGAPTAIALGSFAAMTLRGGTLPRFTAWLAVVTAAAHVVLLFSLVIPRGFFSLEGEVITVVPGLLFAWILVTGIAMLITNP